MIVGTWNPAIFTNGWIARFLFRIPDGQTINASELVELSPLQRKIVYIKNVGVSASSRLIEFFANSMEPDVILEIEKIVHLTITTLPHTPLGGLGVNFYFLENDPDDVLIDSLKARDGIDRNYRVLRQELTSTILVDGGDDVVLNLTRQPSEDHVSFDFNYHIPRISADTAETIVSGLTNRYLQHARQVLRDIYHLEDYDIASHDFNPRRPDEQGV